MKAITILKGFPESFHQALSFYFWRMYIYPILFWWWDVIGTGTMENKSKAETAQINFWHLATEDNFSQKYSIQNKSVLKGIGLIIWHLQNKIYRPCARWNRTVFTCFRYFLVNIYKYIYRKKWQRIKTYICCLAKL